MQTIGEFARQTGLTERALRLYEERGLLMPAFVDPETGYRHYSRDQVSLGQFVAMLRSIDMPLAVIRDVMEAPPSERAEKVARYWYSVERALDGRRHTVRQLRSVTEEQEYGMSQTDTVILEGKDNGAFAAVAALAEISDSMEAADAYKDSMKTAYWDEKDLPLVVAIAYAGVGRLLAAANEAGDVEAHELRSAAKSLMYDLASFSWVGWNESGIEISPTDSAAGLAAARSNLALATQLDKGDLALSRAHWMLGAHLLTAGHPTEAKKEFEKGRDSADRAGATVEMELATAFAFLADVSAGDEGALEGLAGSRERLAAFEDGEFFVEQVDAAREVLGL